MQAGAGGGSDGRGRTPKPGAAGAGMRMAPADWPRTVPLTQPLTQPTQPTQRRAPAPPAPPRQPSRLAALLRKPAVFVAWTLAIVVPLGALVAGLLYLKLMHGPMSVRFLVEPIERALNAGMPDFAVDIEDAVLRLSERGGFEFRLKNLAIRDGGGQVVAAAKLAGLELSTRALRSGRLSPSRIDLIEPEFVVMRTEAGGLAFSSAGRAPPVPAAGMPPGDAAKTSAPVADREATPAGQSRPAPYSDIAAAITKLMARMRVSSDAAAHIEAIGLRAARLRIEGGGRSDTWSLPEVDISLVHRQKRSTLVLDAKIESGGQPWRLTAHASEGSKSTSIPLDVTFESLVPRRTLPVLAGYRALEGLDMPIDGHAQLELGTDGVVRQAQLELVARPGAVYLAWLDGTPLPVERGRLAMRFDGETRRLEIAPSELATRDGRIVLAGAVVPDDTPGAAAGWRFDIASTGGHLESPDRSAPPLAITRLTARGKAITGTGEVELSELALKAGAAEVTLSARIGAEASLEGRIGAMSIADLKSIWPAAVAPRARSFALQALSKGMLKGGTFRIATARDADVAARKAGDRRLSVALEGADFEVAIRPELPPLEIPRALLHVEGNALELTVPDASIAASGGRRITFKGGRATVVETDKASPVAEIAFRAQGPLPAVLELAERDSASPLKGHALPIASIDGKTEAQLRVVVPLGDSASLADMRIEGKARVTDARVKDVIGTHDISGATVAVDLTEKGLDLKGDALVAGIPAKVQGHLPAPGIESKSLPLVITARLDDADRTQIGLEIDSMITGEVPVQITMQRGVGDEPMLHVTADLTSAELMLDELAWRKPMGRPARLDFDVGRRRQSKVVELQNFKLAGETIAVNGWVALGPDNKAREYYFPEFSLNVVTNLEVQGTLRPDRVWDVKAHGKTLDATDVFRSLFAIAGPPPKPRKRDKPGVDLVADIETVTGANDTAMRQIRVKAMKRQDQIVSLDVRGTMDGGGLVAVAMQPQPGRPRTVQVETSDTGQALKMIGFYPNMVGGKGRLDVNLDARGAIEKTGRLRVRNYRILGDAIVSEVFQNADDSRPAIASSAIPRRRVVREQFDFESLNAEFAVGNAQLVIEQAVALGPLIGASLKGKLDFRAQRMQLGGTYVPLSGLSRAIGQIPLLGQILTGPKGEGVLGITFEISGAMADPQVVVNPLSMLTPGFTREIFQMTPENPRVTPRLDQAAKGGESVPQVRSSAPAEARPAATEAEAAPRRPQGEIGDGWATTTEPKAQKKKRPPEPSR